MELKKLKSSPSSKIVILVSVLAFLIFILINQLIFAPLAVNVASYGILDFEFAWTADQITIIFNAWGAEGMALHNAGVYWDFLYILGYAPFISGLVLLIARKISGKPQKTGLIITLAPIIAGICDAIENSMLLVMLANPGGFSSLIPVIAGVMAIIKFSLLVVAILYFVVELIIWLVASLKK